VLVGLVPAVQLEAKVFPEIVDDLADEGTAIQVERSVIVLLSLLPVFGTVWNSKVFLGCLYELLSQSLFEVSILPVFEGLL